MARTTDDDNAIQRQLLCDSLGARELLGLQGWAAEAATQLVTPRLDTTAREQRTSSNHASSSMAPVPCNWHLRHWSRHWQPLTDSILSRPLPMMSKPPMLRYLSMCASSISMYFCNGAMKDAARGGGGGGACSEDGHGWWAQTARWADAATHPVEEAAGPVQEPEQDGLRVDRLDAIVQARDEGVAASGLAAREDAADAQGLGDRARSRAGGCCCLQHDLRPRGDVWEHRHQLLGVYRGQHDAGLDGRRRSLECVRQRWRVRQALGLQRREGCRRNGHRAPRLRQREEPQPASRSLTIPLEVSASRVVVPQHPPRVCSSSRGP